MRNIKNLIKSETKRQKETINLIASENYVSDGVLEALGSVFTDKYSEGYPGKRYYPGNEVIDEVETQAQYLARKAFRISKNWRVNVQALSGSPANLAVYYGLLKYLRAVYLAEVGFTHRSLGEGGLRRIADNICFLGMKLDQGGHLTHGSKASISGDLFNFIQYGLDKKEKINYEEVRKLAKKHKPALIVCGATAYPRKINFKKFKEIADETDAFLMADISHIAGLIAGGAHQSPFPYVDVVMTTTHKTLRGPRGALIFTRENIGFVKGEKVLRLANFIDKAVFPGLQGGPHNHQTLAIMRCLEEVVSAKFKKYAGQIVKNSVLLADELKKSGFDLVSGGTDNHLILIDLSNSGLSGKEAENMLYKGGISVNKNAVPGEKRSSLDPSGIRIGTAAITTRGMKEKDVKKIAGFIINILINKNNPTTVKKEVVKFVKRFSLFK